MVRIMKVISKLYLTDKENIIANHDLAGKFECVIAPLLATEKKLDFTLKTAQNDAIDKKNCLFYYYFFFGVAPWKKKLCEICVLYFYTNFGNKVLYSIIPQITSIK